MSDIESFHENELKAAHHENTRLNARVVALEDENSIMRARLSEFEAGIAQPARVSAEPLPPHDDGWPHIPAASHPWTGADTQKAAR